MRGERATLGKSLLDVERELRIRATYVAAIENGDIGAFQSAGFIAGYVRSYARYLGMEPERTFQRFCEETGFRGVHGGHGASLARKPPSRMAEPAPLRVDPNDVMRRAPKLLAPTPEPWLQRLEPGALGSIAVLLVLAAGIGYGAWAIFQDVQRLSIAPVDEAPAPLAQLDPLTGAQRWRLRDGRRVSTSPFRGAEDGGRLYRPEPLESPVLAPRDEALATLDPDEVGTLSTLRQADSTELAQARPGVPVERPAPGAGHADPAQRRGSRFRRATHLDPDHLGQWHHAVRGYAERRRQLDAARKRRAADACARAIPVRSISAVNGVTLGPAGTGASIVRDVELSADRAQRDFRHGRCRSRSRPAGSGRTGPWRRGGIAPSPQGGSGSDAPRGARASHVVIVQRA